VAPSDDLAHARGNLALVLRDQQRYAESRSLLLQTLDHFEHTGEQFEIVRTLTHLLELGCNRRDPQEVLRWRDRLRPALTQLEGETGTTDVSVSATGALANGILMFATESGDTAALKTAETLFASVEATSRKNGKRMLTVAALAQRAGAVRYQDRLPEALALYQQARQEAEAAHLQKIAADSLYNEAIVCHEMGDAQAIERMLAARDRYRQLGDHESEEDAADSVARWSRGDD
jgi:tetratricopeptide (TPR) repeat protein